MKIKKGRYGEGGYLINIHSPTNPITGESLSSKIGFVEYK